MKIAVFAINPAFYREIGEEFNKAHTVRMFDRTDNDTFNLIQTNRLIDWCDLAYFEFAQTPLNIVTHLTCMNKPIVVRGHGIPLFAQHAINWNKVSALIVSPICKQMFLDQKPKFIPKIHELAIGVDQSKFVFSPNKVNKKFNKRIVLTSSTWRPKKRIYTSLQQFAELYDEDPEWKLILVGDQRGFKEATISTHDEYLWPIGKLIDILGIRDALYLDKHMPHAKWAEYLWDKDIIWSNSVLEGYHCSLAEGMLTGMYPIINHWYGAENYYPSWAIHDTWKSMKKEFLDWGALSTNDKHRNAVEARNAMCTPDNDVRNIARKIRRIIENAD